MVQTVDVHSVETSTAVVLPGRASLDSQPKGEPLGPVNRKAPETPVTASIPPHTSRLGGGPFSADPGTDMGRRLGSDESGQEHSSGKSWKGSSCFGCDDFSSMNPTDVAGLLQAVIDIAEEMKRAARSGYLEAKNRGTDKMSAREEFIVFRDFQYALKNTF